MVSFVAFYWSTCQYFWKIITAPVILLTLDHPLFTVIFDSIGNSGFNYGFWVLFLGQLGKFLIFWNDKFQTLTSLVTKKNQLTNYTSNLVLVTYKHTYRIIHWFNQLIRYTK